MEVEDAGDPELTFLKLLLLYAPSVTALPLPPCSSYAHHKAKAGEETVVTFFQAISEIVWQSMNCLSQGEAMEELLGVCLGTGWAYLFIHNQEEKRRPGRGARI